MSSAMPYMGMITGGTAATVTTIGGIIAGLVTDGQRQKAAFLRQQAVAKYGDQIAPELDRIVAEQVGKTNLGNEDPRARDAQYGIMQQMLGETGEASYNADLAHGQLDAARMERGHEQALDADMAARGMSGSGLEYLGKAMGIQNAGEHLYMSNTQAAADREKAKMQRLMGAANVAGNLRNQNMESLKAQDQIDQFNAQMRSGAAKFNAGQQQQEWQDKMDLTERQYQSGMTESEREYQAANDKQAKIYGVTKAGADTFANVGSSASDMMSVGKKKKPDDSEE